MKIAIVYFDLYFSDTGMAPGARRVRDMARGLAAQGHSIHICLLRRTTAEKDVEMDLLKLTFLGRAGINKLSNRKAYWSQLVAMARDEGLDWLLLYNTNADAALPARRLQRMGVKIAAEACDLKSAVVVRNSFIKWNKWVLYKINEAIIPKITDLNIAISHFLMEDAKSRAPSTPRLLIPALVDSELFKTSGAAPGQVAKKWDIPQSAELFAYVGGLKKLHGVRHLISAFAKIADKYPQARLIIAGRIVKDSAHDDIEAQVASLGLTKSVVMPGWVSTDDVIAIYSRADVLVLPQIAEESMLAALPTKLAEYSQMGKAIVSTNVGDIGLYFRDGENALLVESGKPDEMAKALARLVEDPELSDRLGANAKKVTDEHFDYRKAGKRLSDELIRLSD